MKPFCKYLCLVFLILSVSVKSQVNLDSLWGVWNNSSQLDSSRFSAISKIIKAEPDSAFVYYQLIHDFAKKINNKKWLSKALFKQGIFNYGHGDYDNSLESFKKCLAIKLKSKDALEEVSRLYLLIGNSYFQKDNLEKALIYYKNCLKIREEIGDKYGISQVFNNLGLIYRKQSNYSEALICYQKSLKIKEEIGDKISIANTLNNIGNVYFFLKDFDQSLQYFKKSLDFKLNSGKTDNGASLFNIGNVYYEQKKYDEALVFLKRSLKTDEESGNKSGVALLGIGKVYYEQKKYDEALIYFNKSLKTSKEAGTPLSILQVLSALGDLSLINNNKDEALNYYLDAIQIAVEIGSIKDVKINSKNIFEIHKEKGNSKKALVMHEMYVRAKDSLIKMDAEKATYKFEIQTEYEFAKKADSIKHVDEIIIQQAETKIQKQRSIGLFIIAMIVIISLIMVFWQLRKVSFQKNTIEEKQKEITASINYAKHLQQGILVPFALVQSWLSQSFIFYKPKDIVSGDFYWIEKVGNRVYFAVADCTGHGIPGALVSIICSSALSKTLYEDLIHEPSKILDNTRKIVEERFERSTSQIKDGMDISLCCLDVNQKVINWSGAMNPLWIVRKNAINIEELKPDRQPIGRLENPKQFTQHELRLDQGDSIYLFSDGYQDQFGGPNGKKYMKGKFKKFILSVQSQPMQEQLLSFDKEFNSWTAKYEQLDDVCVMGVRI